MMPVLTVTETTLTVHSHRFPEVHPAAWRAVIGWVEFHGMDPYRIPMCQTIVRNVKARCVEYDEIQVDEAGRRRIVGPPSDAELVIERVRAQGETPPLPWPAELLERVDVESCVTGELLAQLCRTCDAQLPPRWVSTLDPPTIAELNPDLAIVVPRIR
jgi:hypothetical protein